MDLAGAFMDKWLGGMYYDYKNRPYYLLDGSEARRVIYYHDEYQWEARPVIAERIGEMGRLSIIKAGEFFKLNIPLDAEYKIGKSWKDTH